MIKNLIKLIFPPKCVLCEKIVEEEDTLCLDCWNKMIFINKPFCNKCSAPFDFEISEDDICLACMKNKPLYIKSRNAFVYNNAVSKIVFKFKFYDKIHLKRFISKCMCNASKDILKDIDILIPIPLHKKRLIHRKYNQSLILTTEISKNTNKKFIYDFLNKNKHTAPQASLRKSERQTNLKNKFSINQKYLKEIEKYQNLNFAIVDDVITTGSTINECIRILNESGIKNVYAISFAKTVI